jgi:hypothetical protein
MNNPTTQEILGTERRQINMAETKGEKNKKNVLAKGRQFLILIFFSFCFSQEEFEYTKGAIRIIISKKNRQHNGQKKKDKRTNNDLQHIHIKLKIA